MYSPFKSPNYNNEPNNSFVPTEEQLEASKRIRNFLDSNQKVFVLKGYAGTGKTTLVNYILKDYYLKKGKLIAVTAFTNKATNVISRKTPFATGITLYKLLGLQTDESSEKLKFSKTKKALVDQFDIIVLDEVSMVLDRDLNLLLSEINQMYRTTKLIIMGDPCQLNSVGQSTDSIAFGFENSFQLKNIIRQAEDSNIIKYSFAIREIVERINNKEKIPIKTKLKVSLNPEINDLIIFNDSRPFIEMMINEFKSDNYQNNSDYVRAISYRNMSIDKINSLIRKNIFGEHEDTIIKGENITLSYPVIDMGTGYPLYDTSDELEVTEILSSEVYNSKNHCGIHFQFPYYHCLVSRRFDGMNGEMKIVNPNYKGKFNELISEWGKAISKEENKKIIYKEEFYPFKKEFHTISYNYAITVHKSQGGTYNKIFLIEDDLEAITKDEIINLWKAKYVGITRAAKQLIILNRNK